MKTNLDKNWLGTRGELLNLIIDLENNSVKNNSDIIFNIGHLRSYSNFLELETDICL